MDSDSDRRTFLSAAWGGMVGMWASINSKIGVLGPPVDLGDGDPFGDGEGSGDGRDDLSRYLLPSLRWSFETGAILISHPTVVDGVVYVGSNDGHLYAFDGDEGGGGESTETAWEMSRFDLGNTASIDTAAPRDLSERWRYETGGKVKSQPAVRDGRVYFGSHDGTFYCLDEATGEEVWRHDTGGVIIASPFLQDDSVYITGFTAAGESAGEAYGPGWLHELDAEDGSLRTAVQREEAIASSPMVVDGTVYFGCYDGSYYAVDPSTGETVWEHRTGDMICEMTAAVDPDAGRLYYGSEDHNLYGVDADDGTELWRFETDGMIISTPVLADGTLYFGSFDGNLYAVDAETGDERWRFATEKGVFSSPALDDGVLYVGSHDNNVYAVDAATGDEIWRVETEGVIKSSPVVADDMVYIGARETVYAIESESVDEEEYDGGVRDVTEDPVDLPDAPSTSF